MDQPLVRSAFAGFSSRLGAGLIDSLIVFAALWFAFIIRAALGEVGIAASTSKLPLSVWGNRIVRTAAWLHS
jgi:uncharacterized RDD family membrane protein YckC